MGDRAARERAVTPHGNARSAPGCAEDCSKRCGTGVDDGPERDQDTARNGRAAAELTYTRPVRIIAGERKGHTIVAPRGRETRPTSDRVRENVFNIIAPWVEGARVLDLYAGSGAMGLEALSRGAASAVFVEKDPDAVRAIERNLDKLRLTGARVVRLDAGTALVQENVAGRKYDLVFIDPPYAMTDYDTLS